MWLQQSLHKKKKKHPTWMDASSMLEKKLKDIIPNGGEIQNRSDFKRKVVFQTPAFSGDMSLSGD